MLVDLRKDCTVIVVHVILIVITSGFISWGSTWLAVRFLF